MMKLQNYITKYQLKLVDFFLEFDKDGSMCVSREEFAQGIQVLIKQIASATPVHGFVPLRVKQVPVYEKSSIQRPLLCSTMVPVNVVQLQSSFFNMQFNSTYLSNDMQSVLIIQVHISALVF